MSQPDVPHRSRSTAADVAPAGSPVQDVVLDVVLASKVKRNPYVSLLSQALSQCKVDVPPVPRRIAPRIVDALSFKWLWRHRREIDVLHIHWLELFIVYPRLIHSLKCWLSVILGLVAARVSGVRIVYTLHNIEQHEGRRRSLVWQGNRVMLKLAHAVHVHDERTAAALGARWGRTRGVYVIPHGNYVAYPGAGGRSSTLAQTSSRERLGVPSSAFVYLFLGRLRPYKGIEDLLEAFFELPDRDAVLLVAGQAQEADYASRLKDLSRGDDRLHLHLAYVPDEDLHVYMNAGDICVLPYRHVTTSGAAILSFSFHVPIIAPGIGPFPQLVGPHVHGILNPNPGVLQGGRGILYDPDVPGSLLDALVGARGADVEAMRSACAEYAHGLGWVTIAEGHAAMYRSALAEGGAT